MATETSEIWLCADCGMLTANGTSGWGMDEAGAELGDLHAARMAAYDAAGDYCVSGCPEGEHCEHHSDPDDCRFDRDFSSVQCSGCGDNLAGFRFAAVEFISR